MIVGMFGIMKSGAAYVPLDIKYPSDRIAAILKEAGIKILITQDDLLSDVPQMEGLNVICMTGNRKKSAASVKRTLLLKCPIMICYISFLHQELRENLRAYW